MNNEYRDIISFDGTPLKCLIRETGSNKWLIVTHGLGEHSGRYQFLLKLFSQNFNIAIYDLRGHGRSGGRRAYVEDFESFSKDLHSVINFLKKDFSMTNFSLFGHSLGGLITADYVQNMVPKDFYPDKVFLSSPAVAAPGGMGPLFSFAPKMILDGLTKCPSIPLQGILDLKKLSHDRRIYEAYVKDDLCQRKIHSKLFFELLKAGREVFSRPLRVECPLFVAIGTGDALVNSEILINYFEKVEKSSQLKIIDEGYHELHNEIEKYRKPYLNFLRQSLTGLPFE